MKNLYNRMNTRLGRLRYYIIKINKMKTKVDSLKYITKKSYIKDIELMNIYNHID